MDRGKKAVDEASDENEGIVCNITSISFTIYSSTLPHYVLMLLDQELIFFDLLVSWIDKY